MIWLGRLLLVLAFGAVVGVGAFLATSTLPAVRNFSLPVSCDLTITEPRVDPWTGRLHGYRWTCRDWQTGATLSMSPNESIERTFQAIPVPVGFVVGTLAMSALLWIRSRLRLVDRPSRGREWREVRQERETRS